MLTFRLHAALAEIPAPQWDALAGQAPLAHAQLAGLEASGCVAPRTGWTPRHAALWGAAGPYQFDAASTLDALAAFFASARVPA